MRFHRLAASIAACIILTGVVTPTALAVAPANDDFASPVVLDGFPASASIDATAATRAIDDPVCDFYWWHPLQEPTVWFAWTAAADGEVALDTAESEYPGLMNVGIYTGSRGALEEIGCATPDYKWDNPHVTGRFSAAAGTTYYFMLSNAQGQVDVTIEVAPSPANDEFGSATVVAGIPWHEVTDANGAHRSATDPECATYASQGTQTIWYAYTPETSGWIEASNNGTLNDYYQSLGVYTGNEGSLVEVACDAGDPLATPSGSDVRFYATAGTTYHFMIENASDWTVFSVFDAAGPTNDAKADATAVAALPYVDTVPAHWATAAGDDPVPSCGPAGTEAGMPSVWYRYVPDRSAWVTAWASASPDVTLSVWSGSPGSLTEVACGTAHLSDGVSVRVATTKRVEYWFMVSAASSYWFDGGWSGASFALDPGPRLLKGSVTVSRALVTREGTLLVQGFVMCNHDAEFAEIYVAAAGDHRNPASGFTWWTASCTAPSTEWSVEIGGPFRAGPVSITTAAQFADGWTNIWTPETTINLSARPTK